MPKEYLFNISIYTKEKRVENLIDTAEGVLEYMARLFCGEVEELIGTHVEKIVIYAPVWEKPKNNNPYVKC